MAQSMVDLATDFLNNGFVDLGVVLDNQACVDLLRQIYQTRKFDPDLFIDEDQHKKIQDGQKIIQVLELT